MVELLGDTISRPDENKYGGAKVGSGGNPQWETPVPATSVEQLVGYSVEAR
jgi:hypothetical protein